MTGKDLYEVSRYESERLHLEDPLNQGLYVMPPWEQVHPSIQAAWHRKAMEQNARDDD